MNKKIYKNIPELCVALVSILSLCVTPAWDEGTSAVLYVYTPNDRKAMLGHISLEWWDDTWIISSEEGFFATLAAKDKASILQELGQV